MRNTAKMGQLTIPLSARGRVVDYAARGQRIAVQWTTDGGVLRTEYGLTSADMYVVPE